MSLAMFGDDGRPLKAQPTHHARTYKVDMHCTNCGHKGTKEIAKGIEVPRVVSCPICECNTYKSGWYAPSR